MRGDLTYNPTNVLTNVSVIKKIWDFNPGIGGPIVKDKLWFYFTFRHWGVNKTVADNYFNALGPTSLKYHNLDLLVTSYQYAGQMGKAEPLLKQSFAIPSHLAVQRNSINASGPFFCSRAAARWRR